MPNNTPEMREKLLALPTPTEPILDSTFTYVQGYPVAAESVLAADGIEYVSSPVNSFVLVPKGGAA